MIENYSEARVALAPSGELILALPIYANQDGLLFNSEELKSVLGDSEIPKNTSVGIYEHFGYLVYNPELPYSFYMKSLELFEDLGAL